jgi:hypothetical protein
MMLKFNQFVEQILNFTNEDLIYEATSGEVLKDQWERFIESIPDKDAEFIENLGSTKLPNEIHQDLAYVTVYPTIIKVRSKEDGSRISEYKNSKTDLDSTFKELLDNKRPNKFQFAAYFVFWLMKNKPDAISWAPKDSLKKESIALDNFNSEIQKIMSKDGSGTVKLVVADSISSVNRPHVIEVERVDKIQGTPRADFQFVDDKGNPFLFVSHKDGKDAKGFQQYSGMTKDKNIVNHPEVKAFVEKMIKFMEGVYTDKFAAGYATPVLDPHLAALSMFGNEYGGGFGINNCHLLMQGRLLLDPSKNIEGAYDIKASGHFVINPQITGSDIKLDQMGEYRPHLYVRRSKSDSQFGLEGARFMILSGRSDIIPRAVSAFNLIE